MFYRFSMRLSLFIRAAIPGQNGAFAAAIVTGDRSQIDPATLDGLRASNLAHLLAISGLHMGLLTGFVFALLRYGLAIFPFVSLRCGAKKLAAALAIFVGFVYLLVSGSGVATQRAFIMTVVVLMAVILDKPAFTLRAVALAAFLVLLMRPYSVLEAGFQMSFAATTALISSYEWLNGRDFWKPGKRTIWKILRPVLGLVFTSAIAELATAPISAFHFNQISHFGLLANLLAVPIMGLLVMPSAVVAAITLPLGLDGVAFHIMGQGIGAILWIASFFSTINHAVSVVKSGSPWILGAIGFGGLFLFLWSGWGRLIGPVILVFALIAWSKVERPELLISEDGRVFGLMAGQFRVISKPKGSSYAVGIWLENDGDIATQLQSSERDGVVVTGRHFRGYLKSGWQVKLYSGDELTEATNSCAEQTILILPKLEYRSQHCIVIDRTYLRQTGAVAITVQNSIPQITNSRASAQRRPWGD